MIFVSCMSKHEVKTDFHPYADTCESCYNKLSHPMVPKSHKKKGSDSIMAQIKYVDCHKAAVGRNCSDGTGTGKERGKPYTDVSV